MNIDRTVLKEITTAALELTVEIAHAYGNRGEIIGPVAAALVSAALEERDIAEALTGKSYS